jgi:hypothetical protein
MLRDTLAYVLAYDRRTALTTKDMYLKAQLLKIRTERHDAISTVKHNLEHCEPMREKNLVS